MVGCTSESVKQHIIQEYGPIGMHLYRSYGGIALDIVKGDLTIVHGNITKAELEYIIKNEMVTSAEDLLMRSLRFTFLNNK